MTQLANVVKEYKTARENRNTASARNDLRAVAMYNEELTYWADQLSATAQEENVDIKTVRELLR